MVRADVEALRAAGFSDADILAIAEVVGADTPMGALTPFVVMRRVE